MFENNILADLPDKGYDPAALSFLARLQGDYDAPDVIARLAVVCPAINGVEKYLLLSGRERKRLGLLAEIGLRDLSEKSIKTIIYKENNDISLQIVLLFLARRGEEDADAIGLARSWTPPAFPVDGEDANAAGIKPGPAMGAALKAVEAWWIENGFYPDREACLEELKRLT